MTDRMNIMRDELGAPRIVDRNTFQAELEALRVREKTRTAKGCVHCLPRRGRWTDYPNKSTVLNWIARSSY
jgi:hypothetical protein